MNATTLVQRHATLARDVRTIGGVLLRKGTRVRVNPIAREYSHGLQSERFAVRPLGDGDDYAVMVDGLHSMTMDEV